MNTTLSTGGRTAIRTVAGLTSLGMVGVMAVSMSLAMWLGPDHEAQALPSTLTSLSVTSDIAAVEVREAAPGEEFGVEMNGASAGRPSRLSVAPSVDGSSADVTVDCRNSFIAIGPWGRCEAEVVVTVPASTELEIATDVGSATITGWEGPIRAQTDVGEINIVDSRSLDLDLTTSLGDILVTSDVAPESLTVSASLGSFDVTLPADGTAYAVTQNVGLGDLQVLVPQDIGSPHRIDVNVDLGDGRVDTE